MKKVIKKYTNSELTIVWKPESCIHAAICVNSLPNVYNSNEKPWLKIENATTEELKKQIQQCPSGALSYYMNGQKTPVKKQLETKIEVLENGPLLLHSTLTVKHENGEEEKKNKTTSFCRCGLSAKKPYCDGAHIKNKLIG